MRKFVGVLFAAGFVVVALAQPAVASVIPVSSRGALGGNLTVEWSLFGPTGSLIITPDTQNAGPLSVTVGSSEGELARHTEGVDFTGNFAPGDQLLSDAGSSSDSFIIRFSTPVEGVATQIERHSVQGPFTGHLYFFDAGNSLLGEVTVSGDATMTNNNSAVVIGGISTGGFDISRINFTVDNLPQIDNGLTESGDLLINRLDLIAPAAVPEPSEFAVLVPALLLIAAASRRRNR